jgi:hypothetical protein
LHKTATSWFQACFYPRLSSHRWIDRVLVRQTLLTPAFGFDGASARQAIGLDADAKPYVLCDEDLSGVLHNGGLMAGFLARRLAERLHLIAPEAMIVIFVREPVSFAAACYQQYVREGGTGSPRRYLFPEDYRHLTKFRPFKTPRFEVSQLDATGLIAHYDTLFGRENVHVFAYEEFALQPAVFLARYKAQLGIDGGPDQPRAAVNASYRRWLLPIARFANLFTQRSVADKRVLFHIPYWYPVRKYLLNALNKSPLFGSRPSPDRLLGPKVVAWLQGRFATSNQWLAERTEIDLAALGYVLEAPEIERPRRPEWLRALRN